MGEMMKKGKKKREIEEMVSGMEIQGKEVKKKRDKKTKKEKKVKKEKKEKKRRRMA